MLDGVALKRSNHSGTAFGSGQRHPNDISNITKQFNKMQETQMEHAEIQSSAGTNVAWSRFETF